MNKSKRIFLSQFAILICLALFVIGIVFAGEMPFLTVLGIAGLSGIYYIVFRLVKPSVKIEK